MYKKRNIEACSCNHCCCGKVISITYPECVSVDFVTQHAKRMRHIVISSLPGSTIFFHIISYTAGFYIKKVIEHKMCVLIFYTNFEKISHSKKK